MSFEKIEEVYDHHHHHDHDQDLFNIMKNNNSLSRNSSVGCSSRIYYYRSTGTGGIPFEWEMQPGTPKDPPKEEALPPLSPPPAVLSLGLPKPCIIHNIQDQPSNPNRRRRLVVLRFWKKNNNKKNHNNNNIIDFKDERFGGEFSNSDSEFMASPARDSSSSSSSSSLSRQSSRLQSPGRYPPMMNSSSSRANLSCSPWSIRSFLVTLAKRV